jgi:hypothetical protein
MRLRESVGEHPAAACAECGSALSQRATVYSTFRWRRLGPNRSPQRERLFVCSLVCQRQRRNVNGIARFGTPLVPVAHRELEPAGATLD